MTKNDEQRIRNNVEFFDYPGGVVPREDVQMLLAEIDALRGKLAETDAEFEHEFDERTKLIAAVRERDERARKLEDQLADALRRHVDMAIDRDKEFWRHYADHTAKELLRSNGALTDKLIELGREVAARDAQLAALGPWTVQTLRQYVADTSDGFECEPGCDSYGHTEFCPVTNTVAAFRLLRERLHTLTVAFDAEVVHGRNVAGTLNNTIVERDERIRELEQRIQIRAEADAAHEREINRISSEVLAEAKGEVARERQLEQLFTETQSKLHFREEELKSAQERLAEAEALLRLFVWRRSKVIGCTSAQHGETINATKEYFAKHSPSPEEHP